tara:strand:+ start:803 stop:1336 length:534 start_codon:yes stop_codon:yes gene_type:complete
MSVISRPFGQWWPHQPTIEARPTDQIIVQCKDWNWVWCAHSEALTWVKERDVAMQQLKNQLMNQQSELLKLKGELDLRNLEVAWGSMLLGGLRETTPDKGWSIAVDAHMLKYGVMRDDSCIQRAVLTPKVVSPKPVKKLAPISSPVTEHTPTTPAFEWASDLVFVTPAAFPPTKRCI